MSDDVDNEPTQTEVDSESTNAPTPDWKQEALDKHNEYRALHGVEPLELDEELCARAQEYAESSVKGNALVHSSDDVGENMFSKGSSESLMTAPLGKMATEDWYNEIKDHDYDNPNLDVTGHFTQVIWKSSTRLGIGVAFDNNGRKAVVVAQYTPNGNLPSAVAENVPRPQ
ncbi:unnamed protein product [Rotaria sp. Silwood1]|nr:unnamed protein product [Rotaria sp. Silwood1]CAF3376910.1 unnamed protein product [Rotaria sp. Silwood1]CAF4584163.1 unnamed protein product [Rotaria sp. Silwood1]